MGAVGYLHSLQSMGTVDGPGVRAVVFAAGCPLRCVYCHNPDTWRQQDGTPWEADTLCARIMRLYPYIKEGGVTFSGGEPCLQAVFFEEVARELRAQGLHIALDTSGAVWNRDVERLLAQTDLVLLDVKMTSEAEYRVNTGGSLESTLAFLSETERRGIPLWIRHVVVPGLTDGEDNIRRLASLLLPYGNIQRVELLPFRRLCLEKYEALGIPFPLKDTPEADGETIRRLYRILSEAGMPCPL